jgi:hypothetical protein
MSKLKVQIKPKAQKIKFWHLDFDIDLNFGFWNLDFAG